MPNHRERRRLAKRMGLLRHRSKLPFAKYMEEIRRSRQAGNEINRLKIEEMLRSLDEQESSMQARVNASKEEFSAKLETK